MRGNGKSGGSGVNFSDLVRASEGGNEAELLERLLSRMSLREKLGQLSGDTPWMVLALMLPRYGWRTFDSGRNRRLGIPPLRFTDGPRGVCLGHSTCFPVAMARGASWDPDLEERVGEAMGVEARSQGADFFAGICVNLLRHPGWGRAQETFGEDPLHVGVMGEATLRGSQRHLMGCVKHFACNSIEESRFYVDVRVQERALREIYLPHFHRCVKRGAAAVMSAYNKVNGEYCGENAVLLRGILKEEWGFEGLVMSDFVWGVRDGAAGLKAGLDVEMPKRWRYGRPLRRALRRGGLDAGLVDEAAARVLRTKARFARRGEGVDYGPHRVACPEHVSLAREAARRGMVLLCNRGEALPLPREGLESIAVFGRLADRANLGDHGSSQVRPPYAVTPLDGLRRLAGPRVRVDFYGGRDLEKVRRMAGEADAALVVAGLTWREEGEFMTSWSRRGGDREDLRLPRGQEELIKAAAQASGRCVVVLECGSAVDVSPWVDEVEALMVAWYPGMEGGNAIAEVVFGEHSPGGRLPFSWPASPGQLPPFDKRAAEVEYGYWHGYRHFQREGLEMAFPFGFGLTYTEFSHERLELEERELEEGGTLRARVTVSNRGKRPGEEVVQLYVSCPALRVERPRRELKAFKRVRLEPGQRTEVALEVEVGDLAYYDETEGGWLVEKGAYEVLAGWSSDDEHLPLREGFTVR
jgi:beta-glucosidase